MSKIKIPFGWHKGEDKFKDPDSVPSGLACDCICYECKERLQAVHPRRKWRTKWVVKYFRHAVKTSCTGGLESQAHIMAKTVFDKNTSVFLPYGSEFFYDKCEIEKRRDGKQPDIFLTNSMTGEQLVVEIFYSHRMEPGTLAVFREKGLRVMEIDISSMRKAFPSTEEFEWMVLKDSPRKFLVVPALAIASAARALVYTWEPADSPATATLAERVADWWEENWPMVVLWILIVFIGYRVYRYFYPKQVIARNGRR